MEGCRQNVAGRKWRYELENLQDYRRLQPDLEQSIARVLGSLAEIFLLGINEAVGNALEHGSGIDRSVTVTVSLIGRRWLVVRIRDHGPGFAWAERLGLLTDPAVRVGDIAALAERGYGLGVMRAVADRLRYNRQGNEVLLAKRLGKDIRQRGENAKNGGESGA